MKVPVNSVNSIPDSHKKMLLLRNALPKPMLMHFWQMKSLLKFLLLLTKNSKNLGTKWAGGKGKHLWSIMESSESKFECVQIKMVFMLL